jgi:hypothetical protein|tara:strand:+ start:39 stop:665 length:627 start_codon:yes stop_codon:yes gene_type:complete
MHQLNVLIIGPDSFKLTLNELKSYLKFNFVEDIDNLNKNSNIDCDALIFHQSSLEDKKNKDLINNSKIVKILASDNNSKTIYYDGIIKLPTSINEINFVIENSVSRLLFIKNSSIKIKKNYLLDKNEKKLHKNDKFIILTEKEIQLLELFSKSKKSISKKKILSLVWNYSSGTDTHTIETHIYRLRKKINDKFFDDKFILNNNEGYYL